jgi:hypothetical protein
MISTSIRPGARAARNGALAVPFLGLAAAVLLVWQASFSSFSATTDNGVNNWQAGSVLLSDNDSGSVMFNASGVLPGKTDSRCIAVTSATTVPSTVKLYGAELATTKALSSSLDIEVVQGTGAATNGSCADFTAATSNAGVFSGTLAGFTATDFSSGYGTWAPSSSETRTFMITYTLKSTAPQTTQGGTAQVRFVWEAQNS